MVVDGLLRQEGLFDVHSPHLEIACPLVFTPSKWVQRRLSLRETLRTWDMPLALDARLGANNAAHLAHSMSPLIISSFLRNMCGGGAPPRAAQDVMLDVKDTSAALATEDATATVFSPSMTSGFDHKCKGRHEFARLPSTDLVCQVVPKQTFVSHESDKSEVERLTLVKLLHDEAKAVKLDDAEVPIHLWDSFITRGAEVPFRMAQQLARIRQAALQWFRRKLTHDCLFVFEGETWRLGFGKEVTKRGSPVDARFNSDQRDSETSQWEHLV